MTRAAVKKPKKTSVPMRDIPVLPGWVIAEQVAGILGITRSAVHRWMQEGVFASQHSLGDRPLYVVRIEEVNRLRVLHGGDTGHRAWSEATRQLQDERHKWAGPW